MLFVPHYRLGVLTVTPNIALFSFFSGFPRFKRLWENLQRPTEHSVPTQALAHISTVQDTHSPTRSGARDAMTKVGGIVE